VDGNSLMLNYLENYSITNLVGQWVFGFGLGIGRNPFFMGFLF
jgi:hypothetical protein